MMVGATGIVSASATTPLSVRASAAADILSSETSAPPAARQIADAVASDTSAKLPLYNSIEFIYKQDFGRVVLLEQEPDTGQEITQVPSQYRLQQYQATMRAQRRSQMQKLLDTNDQQPQPKTGAAKPTEASTGTTGAAQPAPQVAAAPQPAPQVSAPAATAAVAHVDIKV